MQTLKWLKMSESRRNWLKVLGVNSSRVNPFVVYPKL